MSERLIVISSEELRTPSEKLFRSAKGLIINNCQKSRTLQSYLPWQYALNNFSQSAVEMMYEIRKSITPFQVAESLAKPNTHF
jgi:hypothetical protein